MFGRRLGNLQIVANKPSAKGNVLSNGLLFPYRIVEELPTSQNAVWRHLRLVSGHGDSIRLLSLPLKIATPCVGLEVNDHDGYVIVQVVVIPTPAPACDLSHQLVAKGSRGQRGV